MFQKVVKSEPDKTEQTQETSKAKKSANFTRRLAVKKHVKKGSEIFESRERPVGHTRPKFAYTPGETRRRLTKAARALWPTNEGPWPETTEEMHCPG